MAHRLIAQDTTTIQEYDEIPTDIWFNNSIKGFSIVAEEAMSFKEWEQCVSLLWFDDSLKPAVQNRGYDSGEDEPLLEELDGILPWPSKSRRK